MKMNRQMRIGVKGITTTIGLLWILFICLNRQYHRGRYFAASIILGTLFYMAAMRHIVGAFYKHAIKQPWNYQNAWFREKKFEKELYRVLRVRRWKDYLPTNRPEDFDLHKKDVDSVINTSCRSEVVHETIIVLSFVVLLIPQLIEIDQKYHFLFTVTAVISALIDTVFTIVQRFNRPRLVRLKKRYNL